MLKLEKIIQLLLLAMLTQTGLLLILHPMPHRLVFSQANLLFMVGLLGLLFCCAFYFARELQEIKDSLRQSSNYRHLLLLCGKEVQSGRAVEQMLTESFLSSSLLLLGIDIAVLSPAAPKFVDSDFSLRYRKSWGIALGLLCFSLAKNPQETLCFLSYLVLGLVFAHLLRPYFQRLELSMLAHILRNMIILSLLPFCF